MSTRSTLCAALLAALCLGGAPAAHAASADSSAANVVQAASGTPGGSGASSARSIARAVARDVTAAVETIPGAPTARPLAKLDLSRAGAANIEVAGVTLELPAEGAPTVVGRTAVYRSGEAPTTRIAAQALTGGMRALINITGPSAPERYEFPFGGEVASLTQKPDGSVDTRNATGDVIGTVDAPWARDANGTAVPTHYEIQGTTLIQVVEHRSGPYVYGITADPAWFAVIAVRACIALRCWSWMPAAIAKAWQTSPYTPAVTDWIRHNVCSRTRLC